MRIFVVLLACLPGMGFAENEVSEEYDILERRDVLAAFSGHPPSRSTPASSEYEASFLLDLTRDRQALEASIYNIQRPFSFLHSLWGVSYREDGAEAPRSNAFAVRANVLLTYDAFLIQPIAALRASYIAFPQKDRSLRSDAFAGLTLQIARHLGFAIRQVWNLNLPKFQSGQDLLEQKPQHFEIALQWRI